MAEAFDLEKLVQNPARIERHLTSVVDTAATMITAYGLKVIGAMVLLIAGWMIAGSLHNAILRAGNARPMAFNAARTRSRDSPTALSGRPTMVKVGRPLEMATYASIGRTSIPAKATVLTCATMGYFREQECRVEITPSLSCLRRSREHPGVSKLWILGATRQE